jgi:AraC-like DNA-binding protein
MDVLADVLAVARVHGALLATFNAGAPWGIELPARPGASFHAVVAGTCWFTADGVPPRQLAPGDVVLLPGGVRHELASEPGLPLRRFDEDLKRDLIRPDGELLLDGPGARTRILCAGYSYDTEVAHPVLGLLPPVLQVAATQPETGPWLRTVLDLLAHETHCSAGTGSATAAARLLDVLLVHVVRAWLGTGGAEQGGRTEASWLRGLGDPVTARTLAVLHDRPGEDWTVERLAATVHVSRATLARRFTQYVGEPPLSYLTRWRIELAARRLRGTTLPAAAIAREVGYTSEYAFNRAFVRLRGCPPGRYRRERSALLDV